jgi:prevent-host-death family protein
MTITIRAAKARFSQLVARVQSGEEIIIRRGRTPIAKLVRIEPARPRRRFGALRGRIDIDAAFFEPLPEEELKAWEG